MTTAFDTVLDAVKDCTELESQCIAYLALASVGYPHDMLDEAADRVHNGSTLLSTAVSAVSAVRKGVLLVRMQSFRGDVDEGKEQIANAIQFSAKQHNEVFGDGMDVLMQCAGASRHFDVVVDRANEGISVNLVVSDASDIVLKAHQTLFATLSKAVVRRIREQEGVKKKKAIDSEVRQMTFAEAASLLLHDKDMGMLPPLCFVRNGVPDGCRLVNSPTEPPIPGFAHRSSVAACVRPTDWRRCHVLLKAVAAACSENARLDDFPHVGGNVMSNRIMCVARTMLALFIKSCGDDGYLTYPGDIFDAALWLETLNQWGDRPTQVDPDLARLLLLADERGCGDSYEGINYVSLMTLARCALRPTDSSVLVHI